MKHTPRGTPIVIPEHGLPGEAEGRTAVAQQHRGELELMSRVLREALTVIGAGGVTVTKTKGVDPAVLSVVVALFTKACKTFRAVQILCEAGLPEDAHTANRTLLEALIAIGWILQKKSRNRAQMYLAHLSKRDEKIFNSWKRTKGLKRYVTKKTLKLVAEQIAESEQVLGTATVARLADSYSGMNLRDTAAAIRATVTYELYYRHSSKYSHGSDLASHAGFPEDGGPGVVLNLSPGPSEELGRAGSVASAFLIAIAQTIDRRFGLGHEERLRDFGERELGFKRRKS